MVGIEFMDGIGNDPISLLARLRPFVRTSQSFFLAKLIKKENRKIVEIAKMKIATGRRQGDRSAFREIQDMS